MAKTFLSYSWDGEAHKQWVHALGTRLREDGCDVALDQWALVPGDQLPHFMERSIRENNFVVIVCTPKYKTKSDARQGGAGYEGDIMTAEVLTLGNHRKFIPVLREGEPAEAKPSWLLGKLHVDLHGNPYAEDQYRMLRDTLLERRPMSPPLGVARQRVVEQSRSAIATKAAVTPFADDWAVSAGPMDEELFLALELDGMFKALRLHTPPDDMGRPPAEREGDGIEELRTRVATLRHSLASKGLDDRLGAGLKALDELFEDYLDIMARRRDLIPAKGLALRQMLQDWNVSQQAELKGKVLSGTEAALRGVNAWADQKRLEKKIELDFAARDRALALEFARSRSAAEGQAAACIGEVAREHGWAEESWHFDPDAESWTRFTRAVFTRDDAEQNAILDGLARQWPRDPWMTLYYVKNRPVRGDDDRARQIAMAASAALRIPEGATYDMYRQLLVPVLARLALEALEERQQGNRLGEGDCTYAGHVAGLWAAWREILPEYERAERLDAEVFALACAGKLADAQAMAYAREGTQAVGPKLAYTMVRISSALGNVSKAAEWMDYGLDHPGQIDVALCGMDPDLAPLRSGKPEEFARLTAVQCKLTYDRQWFKDCLQLTNGSRFALRDVAVSVARPGLAPLQLKSSEVIAPGGTCTWKPVELRMQGLTRGQAIPFALSCREGVCRG